MYCLLGFLYYLFSYIWIDWMSILLFLNLLFEEDGVFFCGGDCDVLWVFEIGGIFDGVCFGEFWFMGYVVYVLNLLLILG